MKHTPITENRLNIRTEALHILRTVDALESNYGLSYIVHILIGSHGFGWKKERHTRLDTFGVLAGVPKEKIQIIINLLLQRGMLEILSPEFGSIGVSEQGRTFISTPKDLWVLPKMLERTAFDRRLQILLKKCRLDISRKEGIPPYEVFTDYTLDRLCEARPEDVVQLKSIPGMTDHKVDTFGHLILKEIRLVNMQRQQAVKAQREKRAHSHSLQEIKALFNTGSSIREIADYCNLKESTVRGYLLILHDAREINLIPWIEKHIPEASLKIGVDYFKASQQARLKEAYQLLGLDYDTLRFCRLYVSHLSSSNDELLLP